jgi:AcrR family transcriptional regulator
MPTVARRPRQKPDLRREIVTAARAMFAEEGFEAVTMRKLAARIDYSPTAIYLHFKDKHALLEAVCEETFARLAARLERLAAKPQPPLQFLRDGLRLYVQFGLQHPSDYTLTFTMGSGQAEPDPDGFAASAGNRAFDVLRVALRRGIEAGDLPAMDVDMAAQGLWASTHGLVALFIAHPHFPWVSRKKLTEHLIDTMIAGLRQA